MGDLGYSVYVKYEKSTDERSGVSMEIFDILTNRCIGFSSRVGACTENDLEAIRVDIKDGSVETHYRPMVEMETFKQAVNKLASNHPLF